MKVGWGQKERWAGMERTEELRWREIRCTVDKIYGEMGMGRRLA